MFFCLGISKERKQKTFTFSMFICSSISPPLKHSAHILKSQQSLASEIFSWKFFLKTFGGRWMIDLRLKMCFSQREVCYEQCKKGESRKHSLSVNFLFWQMSKVRKESADPGNDSLLIVFYFLSFLKTEKNFFWEINDW